MANDLLSGARLSRRNAAEDLRRHVMEYFRRVRPGVGERLPTEGEICERLKVSRSTVRRALEPLERDGWVDRRAGSGTYVGRRVGELVGEGADSVDGPVRGVTMGGAGGNGGMGGVVRAAVLVYSLGDLTQDWYTPLVLQGLDEVGHEQRVVVELLGDRDSDLEAISRRLVLSRPEVLICLSNQLRHAFILRDAIRMGVRCLVSGTPLMSLGLPGVAEDNGQLVRVAMEHLFEKGHRRVGLALPRDNEPWVMERLEAYERMMVKVGETAEVWWTSARRLGEGEAEGMAEWIERGKLSAVIPSGAVPMHALDALVRMGRLSVPGDVSVVSFEPDHGSRGYLGHTQPTRVDLPLREMGGKLAELARGLVEGGTSAGVERMTGRLVEGSTTWLASGRMGR